MRHRSNNKHNDIQHPRLTIAVISNLFSFSYPISVWQGITDAAREHDVNVVYMAGGQLGFNENGEPITRSVLFSLVGPENADGIIIVSSLLRHYVTEAEFTAFCKSYDPLPVVSVGLTLTDIPSIIIENYAGIYEEVVHLIESHGYKRIAFIRGPEGHEEAEERFRGYTDALTAHGIPVDPKLIVTGSFSTISGEEAISVLLDQRHVEIDAIVAASDRMALGAMQALETRNIWMPNEVAVAGFDDIDDARWANPPLTTVRQPYYAMGTRALDMVLKRLAGEDVPEQIQVPTECIIRESCGCIRREIAYAREKPGLAAEAAPSYQALIATQMPEILKEIVHVTGSHPELMLRVWLDTLLKGFFEEIDNTGANTLLPALSDVLHQVRRAGEDIVGWQHVISVLRRHTVSAFHTPGQQLQAEHLWQQARLVVDKTALEAQNAQFDRIEQFTRRMSGLGRELITTFDMADIMNVLANRLPGLGIPMCYLSIYKDAQTYTYPQPAPQWAQQVLAYNEQGRMECPPEEQRFPSRWLFPQRNFPTDRPYAMLATSLDFQEQLLGFVVFEDRLENKLLYRDLRLQISSALQGALLVEQVKEHTHELVAAYEEIRILNRQLQEENLRMSAELDVARRLQQMILPPPEELQQIEELEIVGYMQPADEVGGDYYDVLKENGILHIGIGDVTGHGLESGVLMLMIQTIIRALIEHGETDPIKFVTTLNRTIYKNAQRMGADKTLTFALINYQGGQVKIVGQHEEMLVVRNGGQVERVDTIDLGFSIGLVPDIDQWIAEATVTLEPGDGVVLYTDGITEAENVDKTFYGIERLCEVISSHWDRSAEEIKQAVVDDVTRHIGKQKVYDDLTLVVLKQQ